MERIYTIPLRRGTIKAPRTRRAKKAIFVLKEFIVKHMKTEDIKISEKLNLHIWSQGMRNPIMKVKVVATKNDKGQASVKLFGEEETKPKTKAKATKAAAKPATKPVKAKAPVVDAEIKGESGDDAEAVTEANSDAVEAKPKAKRAVKKKAE
jgi:large subunit ribosomal protein L31e